MKNLLIFALVALALFSCGIFVGTSYNDSIQSLFKPKPTSKESTEDSFIVAQGRLIPNNQITNITAPPGQKIERFLVDVSEYLTQEIKVKKGQEIAVLTGHQLLVEQELLAKAKLADAQLELQNAVDQAESARLAADLALKDATLKLEQIKNNEDQSLNQRRIDNAQKRLDQIKKLLDNESTRDLVSKTDVSDREIDLQEAKDNLTKATKQIAEAKKAAEFAVTSASKNLELADQALKRAKEAKAQPPKSLTKAVELATTQKEISRILAPADGTVLKVFVKEGEAVVNTPLIQTGDLSKMQCVAEVSDRLISQVKIGDKVKISSAAFVQKDSKPTILNGRVKSIDRIVGDSSLPSPNPLALVDKKTVDVIVQIDESDVELARQFVNLQVSVQIESKNASKNSTQ